MRFTMSAQVTTPHAVEVRLAEPLMTAETVAALLAVPRSSVYEYARRQHAPLPAIRIGRHLRFHVCDVERWVAEQRTNREECGVPR